MKYVAKKTNNRILLVVIPTDVLYTTFAQKTTRVAKKESKNMIRLVVDSAADMYKEELAEKNIEMVPLTITIDGKENYQDEYELPRKELYRLVIEEKKNAKTSQPSPDAFAKCFQEAKEKGDELICVMLSSTLSGTYQSALLAKNLVDYDKIHIIDSLSATYGIKIMVDHALKMIEEGHTAEEIVEKLEVLKGKIKILAGIDTLKYLWLGGRVSRTTAIVADAVNVKPGITVSREGAVEVVSKYLGVGRAIKDLVKQVKNSNRDTDYPLYVIYSYQDTNAQKLQKALEEVGIKVEGVPELGATLGVHVGPGAFGVIFIEK